MTAAAATPWDDRGVRVTLPMRTLSEANARSHWTRDGVADALGVDDRDPRVEWVYGQRRGSAKDATLALGYGVSIEILPQRH